MKIAAIICEYNPFHNGHLYQLNTLKKELSADYVIALMSGDFVQRGAPAFCDKFSRAKMALECGIDLVLELPVRYATSSAEFFASGSVFLLNALNCVDFLVFGSESKDLSALQSCADLLADEPEEFQILLKKHLKSGLSFPSARQSAMKELLGNSIEILLSQPNNILAIEYLKALKKYHSKITPYGIQRMDSGYHSHALDSTLASATAIRNSISKHGWTSSLEDVVPPPVVSYLKQNVTKMYPVILDDYSDMIFYQLMTNPHLEEYQDYHPEILDRIKKVLPQCTTITELIEQTKTRNFTYGRISRYLLHILLGIPSYSIEDTPNYGKILGFRKTASPLLRLLKERTSIPIIQKTSQYRELLPEDCVPFFEQELQSAHLYNYVVLKKYGTTIPDDLRHPILVV